MTHIIIDFDGTLTAEENQAAALGTASLRTLAEEVLGVSETHLAQQYVETRDRLLAHPFEYWWEVNGLIASYCDEGAFILNTTTLQTLLREHDDYASAVARAYPNPEYDPIADCTNALFHRHTAEMSPVFRPGAKETLQALIDEPDYTPLILTNSLGDKVQSQLSALDLSGDLAILGDTRQYDMDPDWSQTFRDEWGEPTQIWMVFGQYPIDLRRPAYYRALRGVARRDRQIVVVADTFSLPGALPLMLRIPFVLLRNSYTPQWCLDIVETHPQGYILDDIANLSTVVTSLPHIDPLL